ncbi:MAG TPA: DUF3821 domain-containing protein [Methanospirillum sp.]|nr:DUF3821 domain-containing protein [Methanospirillum sp.]
MVICLLAGSTIADTGEKIPMVQVPQVNISSGSIAIGGANAVDQDLGQSLLSISRTPATEAINYISPGDTVFIGEEYLDIHTALLSADAIAWWRDENTTPLNATPDAILTISDPRVFFVDPAWFVGKTGNWYQWIADQKGPLVIVVAEPDLHIKVWDGTTDEDVTDKEIPFGHYGNFVIESNLAPIMERTGVQDADSRIKISVTSPSGEVYESLIGANYADKYLKTLKVTEPSWFWIGIGADHTRPALDDGWNTSSIDPFNGTRLYHPGVYTIRAECNANGMKDRYKAPDGSDYVNKTVSLTRTVTLGGNEITIQAAGVQPFYPGDTVHLSGVNQISDTSYLFMTGQGIPLAGGSLAVPTQPVLSNQPASFTTAQVSDLNTWSYLWTVPREITWNGTYVLYAGAEPKNLTDIGHTPNGSVPVFINTTGAGDQINLLPGWNFISTPYILKNGHETMGIFADVNSSGHSILSYDGLNQSWITMKANDTFVPLTGMWIYSTQEYEVPLEINTSVMVPSRSLITGWNSLGITSPDRPVDKALSSIQSLWSYLVGYDASLQKYHDPLMNEFLPENSTILKTKEGFWIFMKENGTYSG